MDKFYYKLYGLNIESEIECPELIKSKKSNDDIKIIFGKVPDSVFELMNQGCNGYCTQKIMWFNICNVAIYYVYEGKQIIIQTYDDACDYKVKAFLLGTALGMLLIQRNIIAIHGGTVLVGNKAITIVGDSGAGKSTLVSALRIKGYPFMADDVSTLYHNMVNFSYPIQKLCKDTMINFGYDLNKYEMISIEREKYIIPIDKNFVDKSCELKAIFQISKSSGNTVEIEEVNGYNKFKILMDNIYRVEILNIIGVNHDYFEKCMNLIKKIHVYKIKRPENEFSVDEQINLIENAVSAI